MWKYLKVLIILLVLVSGEEEDDVFVATKQWQVVKKGQKIPKGLHVRMNLETGLTEAKLLDENEETPSKKTAVLAVEESEEEGPTHQEALRNIKGDDILNPDDIKKIKDEFKSYEEIKASLGELNLTPKIDAEVIAELLQRHAELIKEQKPDEEEIATVLEDLDFLVHQYDNALEFVQQNGLIDVIYRNLNSTSVVIRKDTLRLLASLLQNNDKPKISALESGAVGAVLRLLDSDNDVKSSALSALGALLRSFPVAQKKLADSGGFAVLFKVFNSGDVKLQLKVATLIADLISERHFALLDDKLRGFYSDFDLERHVIDLDWCGHLDRLLLNVLAVDSDDHDSIDRCLTAMHVSRAICIGKFDKNLLNNLSKRYQVLGIIDETDDSYSNSSFFKSLKKLCDDILKIQQVRTEL